MARALYRAPMHSHFYRKNRAYAEGLRDRDPRQFQSLPTMCASSAFHQKYLQALVAEWTPGSTILDVGCGVGQVVLALAAMGMEARGVDVAEESIAIARSAGADCRLFDGKNLPFENASVDSVGAFNVLEHVEHPVQLLDEMLRVLKPVGRMVASSPNFLRVLGWGDYHPHMRGLAQKWRNLKTLRQHARIYAQNGGVVFKRMEPIVREPFQPDDDAITATSMLDLHQYFCSRNFVKITTSCVDRPVPAALEKLLDLTPLRGLMFNAFVTGEKAA